MVQSPCVFLPPPRGFSLDRRAPTSLFLKCLQFLCECSKIALSSPFWGKFRVTPDVSGLLPAFQAASQKPCKRQFEKCIFKHSCFFEYLHHSLNSVNLGVLRGCSKASFRGCSKVSAQIPFVFKFSPAGHLRRSTKEAPSTALRAVAG